MQRAGGGARAHHFSLTPARDSSAQGAQFLLQRFDPLEIAQNKRHGIRVKLEVAPQTPGCPRHAQ